MMQHIAGAMFVEGGGPQPAGSGSDRRGRMMLVAVPPELMPPISFGSTLFQRLRVVLIHDEGMGDLGASSVVGELPQLRTAAALAASSTNPLRHSRRLQGELLCDESGRLYEKIGHYVHPVHHLVAGPHGEVLDLAPPSARRSRGRPSVAEVANDEVIDAEVSPIDRSRVTGDADAPAAEPRTQAGPLWRELSPASARSRVVRFGEFKAILAPRLVHPERLRDAHRLACRVRVFESGRVRRFDTLASEILRGASGQLLPLTPALAAKLEIVELVPPRSVHAKADPELGLILPGERVVWLEVCDDPTALAPPIPPRTTTTPDPPPAAAVAAPPMAEARGPKKTIPDRFLAPWQFAVSRDEALYDLNMEAARFGLGSLIDRWLGAARSGREFRKWQILLTGRSLDDQLWAVRPPRRGLSNRLVRDWARRTLEAAGYDPGAMLLEWEIYWRRKGAGTPNR